MLNRCACGKYTDFGVTCVSCSITKSNAKEIEDINLDELVTIPKHNEEQKCTSNEQENSDLSKPDNTLKESE